MVYGTPLVPVLRLKGERNDNVQMNQYEIESLWVKDSLEVAFQFGDVARVKAGEHIGKEGRVIALFTLEPHPTYMMELPDGSSVVAPEPDLELILGNTESQLMLVRE
jgi:hypothetical protein